MSHPYYHSVSSAKKFGGKYEDYLEIHSWFDQTKEHVPDGRHRMVLHNTLGIFLCEQVFGITITNSDGKKVPTRLIGEQHVSEDFGGYIPSLERCLDSMSLEPWMTKKAVKLSKYLGRTVLDTTPDK